ncbi:hypothetical protein [Citricoccus sp. GCM10030269]|uniref:hypothetical protein n=1 Tax=Citricoccus sp. GCM10030269 TaxID=3273388 RepID=UPI003622318A
MTSDSEQPLPSKPTTSPQPAKPTQPANGVTARSNTADAWDQIRHSAESTTRKLNDFRHRNQSRPELEKTLRQFAERGREETGRGLRALAEAAGKLADAVDRKPGATGQHSGPPRELDQRTSPEA